jgi:hypothetical protein
MVRADIPDADVVAHDDNDVRPLPGCRRRRWWLLRLRGTCQSDSRERRSGYERAAAQQEIAAFQATAGWSRNHLRLFRNLIVIHDVILFLVMHLKPTWLAEVSIGSA